MEVALPQNLVGSYKYHKNEGFDEYLIAMGVSWFIRMVSGNFFCFYEIYILKHRIVILEQMNT